MIGFIVDQILGPFWPYIAGALAVVAGWFTARRSGVNAERAKRTAQDAKAEREAHERINKADTGAGLSDEQRTERLREYAAKHGNRPPKTGGR
jgi:hypothetical protein